MCWPLGDCCCYVCQCSSGSRTRVLLQRAPGGYLDQVLLWPEVNGLTFITKTKHFVDMLWRFDYETTPQRGVDVKPLGTDRVSEWTAAAPEVVIRVSMGLGRSCHGPTLSSLKRYNVGSISCGEHKNVIPPRIITER